MARFAPFEPRPLLAVAVSGGADSVALALLAQAWAKARRGRVLALTVDHGLRADSAAEAVRTGRWLAQRGLDHTILRWDGAKPATGLQAAARQARYALMEAWCRRHGVLHLLLAHHRGDQAETVAMRQARGSGPDGVAGMAALAERASVRIIRPLLTVGRGDIEAYLRRRGQAWIEDPSNADPRFERVRVRAALALRPDRTGTLLRRAACAGPARTRREGAVAACLARAVTLRGEGFAELDPAALCAAPRRVALAALAALLACVGGRAYPPRRAALAPLHAALAGGTMRGRTLAGCRLMHMEEIMLVMRENRGLERRILAVAGGEAATGGDASGGDPPWDAPPWDGRWRLVPPERPAAGSWVDALGEAGWATIAAIRAGGREGSPAPYAAALTLPALWDRHGLAAVPALDYRREAPRPKNAAFTAMLEPLRPLAPAPFVAPVPFDAGTA